MSMSRLEGIKSSEYYHGKSNGVCEDIKVKMKLTGQTVVTIGKLL